MKHPKDFLALVYYISLLVVIIVTMFFYNLAYNKGIHLDSTDSLVTPIYTAIIMYVLASLPISLMGFNMALKRLTKYPDDGTREYYYKLYSTLRIVIINIGLIASVIGLYMLMQRSLIWLAGISAIGLILCKPTKKRVEMDLETVKNIEQTENNESTDEHE